METRRSRYAGKNLATFALTATLATAGLGLTGLGGAALAGEGTDGTVTASEPVDQGAAAVVAQTFPQVTPITQTQGVTIELTNEATAASQLLDAINQARAAQGLPGLTRSAALDTVAWQRAAESVVLAADVRPDGSAVTTVDPAAGVSGETLVAIGANADGSAQAVLAQAQATPDGAANLSSAAHTTVGIALVRDAAGAYHWAIVYADAAADATADGSATVYDGTATYTLTVPAGSLTAGDGTTQQAAVEVGATTVLAPGVRLQGAPFAEDATLAFDSTQPLALAAASVTWTSADPAVATVDANGTVAGVADGVTQVSATSSLGTATWNVTVGTGQAAPTEPEQTPEEGTDSEGDATDGTPEQGGEATAEKIDLSTCQVLGITEVSANVDGSPVEPAFSVSTSDGSPVDASEYTHTWSNNTEPGMATLTITANPESAKYTGTLVKTDIIISEPQRTDIASVAEANPILEQTYEGAPVEPAVVLMTTGDDGTPTPLVEGEGGEPGTDYTVSYRNNDAPGEATAVVTGVNEYEGTMELPFTISEPAPIDLSGTLDDGVTPVATVAVIGEQTYTYTGEEIRPEVTVTLSADGTVLEKDKDYEVSYADNIEPGTATVKVSGTGAYTGELSPVTFSIVAAEEPEQPADPAGPAESSDPSTSEPADSTEPSQPEEPAAKDIAQATVSGLAEDLSYAYTGEAITPAITVTDGEITLVEGTDYTLEYANNVEVGEATITITGIGAYAGSTQTVTFAIVKPDAINLRTEGFAIADIPEQTVGATPQVVVSDGTTTLVEGTDYTVRYERNDQVGTARAVVSGIGAYTGVIDKAFRVVSNDQNLTSIQGARISAIEAQAFTGAAIEPQPTVTLDGATLTAGTDYVLSYANNVNAGTATITITGTGSYTGTISTTFAITAVDLTQVEIVMPNQFYTGSPVTPKPISVTAPSGYVLTEGVDYDITGYLRNTEIGEAGVTLQGKGNFSGTVTAAFKIVEQGASDPGSTNTLPKTGDATSVVPIAIAGVAGVALVGAGAALIARRRREE